jgi:hypothetical protein
MWYTFGPYQITSGPIVMCVIEAPRSLLTGKAAYVSQFGVTCIVLTNYHASNVTKHQRAKGAMMNRLKSRVEKGPIYGVIPTPYGQ